jgi:hypothetical protein
MISPLQKNGLNAGYAFRPLIFGCRRAAAASVVMRSYSAGLRCSILLTVPRCTKGKRPQTWGRGGWGRRLLGRQAAEMASGIRNKRSQGSNSVCAVSDHKSENSPLSTARKARVRSARVQDSPCEVRTLKPRIGSPRRLIRWRTKPPRVCPPLSNGPGLCVPSRAVFSTLTAGNTAD